MSTFVSVGNATQPFGRLLAAVDSISKTLPQPVVVQYGVASFASRECTTHAFLGMDTFEMMVADAELLIMHAGAGSVIHAIRAGKIPVVMPRRGIYREHVDDHQVEFARELAAAGRAVVAMEPEHLADAVEEAQRRQAAQSNKSIDPPLTHLVARLLDEHAARLRL